MLNSNSLFDRLVNLSLSPQECLINDLTKLFNTTFPYSNIQNLDEVKNSIVNYGLLNFSEYGSNIHKVSQQIKNAMEELIASHEPRLKNVIVKIEDLQKNSMIFSITATMLNSIEPIKIKFDSKYQPDMQEFKLQVNPH